MNKVENVYGLNSSDSVVDPHLLKNDEWGAVAYLSKSKYGKENEEVYINNNQNYVTGDAGSTASASYTKVVTNTYNTVNGQKASTTGNIYGVYDMSGGAEEYVAAYIASNSEYLTNYATSLIASTTPERYRNVYIDSGISAQESYALTTPENGHYGDALYETSNGSNTSGWYSDITYYQNASLPVLSRGYGYLSNTNAGIFSFYCSHGGGNNQYGFRVAIPVL